MGVLLPDPENVTRFSYLEYQAIMVCLAAIMSIGLLAIELTMNRFQVLPLLFPGMFSIREQKFYFFDNLVDNVAMANKLRSHAKMLMRMTLLMVLSYVWQFCVMDTGQKVGTDFPAVECDEEKDCFASELHFMTLLRRQYTPVNCNGDRQDFPSRVVVSCIKFITPSASRWLMHLAIAHSITQLNLKAFEILTWIAGNSSRARMLLRFLTFVTLIICIVLFFGGLITEFASSWLSFVTILGMPLFLRTTNQTARVLEALYKDESLRVQESIESHLNSALAQFGPETQEEEVPTWEGRGRNNASSRARAFLKAAGFPAMRGPLGGRGRSSSGDSKKEKSKNPVSAAMALGSETSRQNSTGSQNVDLEEQVVPSARLASSAWSASNSPPQQSQKPMLPAGADHSRLI